MSAADRSTDRPTDPRRIAKAEWIGPPTLCHSGQDVSVHLRGVTLANGDRKKHAWRFFDSVDDAARWRGQIAAAST